MANPDAPFGFKVWKHGAGGTPGRTNEYLIASAYAAAIYEGDLVKQVADGTIEVAGEGDAFIGIFKGVRYTATDGSIVFKNNWVASTATKSGTLRYAIVSDDPNALYLVQATATIALADIGQLADMDNAATGDATTGKSAQAIVIGGAEGGFRVVDVLDVQHGYPIRNAAGNQDIALPGANAYCVVKPLEHQLGTSAATEV